MMVMECLLIKKSLYVKGKFQFNEQEMMIA